MNFASRLKFEFLNFSLNNLEEFKCFEGQYPQIKAY